MLTGGEGDCRLAPEPFEPGGVRRGVLDRMLNFPVSKVILNVPGIPRLDRPGRSRKRGAACGDGREGAGKGES
jgi:hypothetical protein